MITTHYAVQTFDRSNSQNINRYATNDRSEITKKCVLSFVKSVRYAANRVPSSKHIIRIIDDGSTDSTIEFLNNLIAEYSQGNIHFELILEKNLGVMGSIRHCYEWLRDQGKDLVYQVQDDYMYNETAIFEMIDVFHQIFRDTGDHAIVSSYNDPNNWQIQYRYRSTPRVIIPGNMRYWIQIYDGSCTFMTSAELFRSNWDLWEKFLNMSPLDSRLEAESINHIYTVRGKLGVCPIQSVGLHMQSELEKDPYLDWKILWDQLNIDSFSNRKDARHE